MFLGVRCLWRPIRPALVEPGVDDRSVHELRLLVEEPADAGFAVATRRELGRSEQTSDLGEEPPSPGGRLFRGWGCGRLGPRTGRCAGSARLLASHRAWRAVDHGYAIGQVANGFEGAGLDTIPACLLDRT